MDSVQKTIEESIALLEERQRKLQKVVDAANRAEDTSFELRLDGIDPYVRFRRNLSAFQEYIPDIYNFFKNHEPKKYDAVLTAEGELNVLEIEQNGMLYSSNPRDMLAQQYLAYRQEPNMSHYDIDPGDPNIDFVHVHQMRNLRNKLAEIYKDDSPGDHFPEAIKSLMLFGVGLGYHLEWLVRDCQIRNLYIFEPEVDLFYVSLFSIDWEFILKKVDSENGSIHLSIDLAPIDHFGDLQRRMNARGQYDASYTYCMVHYRSERMLEVIDEVMSQFDRLIFGYGFFDDALMSISHQMGSLRKGIPFFGPRTEQYDNTPVFLVANGPSLDGCIELIKQNRDKAIIVSLSSAITSLYNYGIKPDLHLEMERTRIVRTVLDAVKDPEYFRDIPLIALNTVHPEVYDLFDKKYIYAKTNEAGTNLLTDIDFVPDFDQVRFCNPTVSNMGMSVMASLGYKKIYLLGMDMGFPNDKHHAQKSIYFNDKGDDKKLFEIKQTGLRTVPGNFGGEVSTDAIFWQSARVLGLEIEEHEGLEVFNLADGAQIPHAKPLRPEAISLTDPDFSPCDSLARSLNTAVPIPICVEQEISRRLKDGRFDEVLDQLIAIIKEPCQSRFDLMLRVDKQFEVIYGLENSKDLWLADMIRGSLLYIHTLTQKAIMIPEDAQDAIRKYDELCTSIIEYFEACRNRYHERMDVPDQTDLSHIWK